MMRGATPRLSYSQLFSFQVAHRLVEAQMTTQRFIFDVDAIKDMLKTGEWSRSILEIDFTNGMVFLQDREKIIAAQPFTEFEKFVVSGEVLDDNIISLKFNQQQWQIMTQNSAEKACMTHLLSAAAKDLSAEEAVASAASTVLGLNKTVLRAGTLVRKTKTEYKRVERYLVVVPGKLFLFKSGELVGQHVRYVTSLLGASVKTTHGLEFEILVSGTKSIGFVPDDAMEMAGWISALERSVDIAADLFQGQPFTPPRPPPGTVNMDGSENPQPRNGPIGWAVQTAGGHGRGRVAGLSRSESPHVRDYLNPRQDSKDVLQRIHQGGLNFQGDADPGGYGRDRVAGLSRSESSHVSDYLNPREDSRDVLQHIHQGGLNFQGDAGPGGLKILGDMDPGSYNPGGGNSQPPFVGGNFPAYNMQPRGIYESQQAGTRPQGTYVPQQAQPQPQCTHGPQQAVPQPQGNYGLQQAGPQPQGNYGSQRTGPQPRGTYEPQQARPQPQDTYEPQQARSQPQGTYEPQQARAQPQGTYEPQQARPQPQGNYGLQQTETPRGDYGPQQAGPQLRGNYGPQQAGPSNYHPKQMNQHEGQAPVPGQLYQNNLGKRTCGPSQNFQFEGFNQPQTNRINSPPFNNMPGDYKLPQGNRISTPVNSNCQNMNNPGGQIPTQAGLYIQPTSQNQNPRQNDFAEPAGVRFLRRATQTLREFNNSMDQYLSISNETFSSGPIQQAQMGGQNSRMAVNQGQVATPSSDWPIYTSPDGQS